MNIKKLKERKKIEFLKKQKIKEIKNEKLEQEKQKVEEARLIKQDELNLINEGFKINTLFEVGSPLSEVIKDNFSKIEKSNILKKILIPKKKYIIASIHREENVDSPSNFTNLLESIDALTAKYAMPIIISTHPRTRNKLDDIGYQHKNKLIRFSKPYGFHDYNNLQINSKACLSDSGTINEESSILNFPALNLREAHERPEGMEEGSVMMVGLELNRIIQAIEILDDQPRGPKNSILREVADYQMPNVSDKILRIILSYIDYVNRVVWKK
jgi:UDP-N-acetylglucosamine 2-epimerase (non-hydrolysing)